MGSRRARRVLRVVWKAACGLGMFAVAAALMWHGAGMVAARMNRVEPSPVSFADPTSTTDDLVAANHSPAAAGGSFLAAASIEVANVRGVRVWVGDGQDGGRGIGHDAPGR